MSRVLSAMMSMLLERAREYAGKTVELVKLKVADKAADVIFSLVYGLVIFIIAVAFTLVLNIAIALWIGELCGKFSYGFFIVAGFYGLVGILIYTFRHGWIKKFVRNLIIARMLEKEIQEN